MNYYIDLFCGAGGTSTGVERARGCKVVACVNHDPKAIQSHKANYPDAIHFTEDVREMKVIKQLQKIVEKIRKDDPEARIIIWASLECTNFSKAKGGLPRDADSRTLALCLLKYIDALNPDCVWIENVEEFLAWGPLRIREDKTKSKKGVYSALKLVWNKKKKVEEYHCEPQSRKNGKEFLEWKQSIINEGFRYDHKILNSADYGAYTSRKRLFIQFVRKGLPIVWPEPTHSKEGHRDVFGSLEKWKPVKDVLDFRDKGESIFARKKELSENTFKRIYAGLMKYVAGGDTSFIKKYYSGRPMGKVISVNAPGGTITTIDGQALVQCGFLAQYNGGGHDQRVYDSERPLTSISTNNRHAVVQPAFITDYYGNGHEHDVEKPLGTIMTKDKYATVQPDFMVKYYGTATVEDVESPCGTLTTKDRFQAVWLDKQFTGEANHQSIEKPAGSILGNDKHALMQAQQYIMNPQYNSKGGDTEKPCFTLIARMDKAPPYLVQVETGDLAIVIYKDDCEPLKNIKLFMAAYGIIDIKMRMLRVDELLRIQGFPDGYILKGNQTDQKKFIGNSVVPEMAKALAEAQALKFQQISKAA